MRPIALGPCSTPREHEAEVLVRSHPVGPAGQARGLLTLWRCPVDGWGGFWHDLRRDPRRSIGGGPSLESLPGG